MDRVNLQMIHMTIKVCPLRSGSILMLLVLIFPWCPRELTSFKSTSIDTSHLDFQTHFEKKTFVIWPESSNSASVGWQ